MFPATSVRGQSSHSETRRAVVTKGASELLAAAEAMYQIDTSLMAAPKTPEEALKAARDAVEKRRYDVIVHFHDRLADRRITVRDAFNAIQNATSCAAYGGRCTQGGSAWRITGPDLDEATLTVGVEVSVDHLGGFMILITTF